MCDIVEVTDNEGTSMWLKMFLGRYYPFIFVGNVKDQLEAIANMEVRDDDTFILSYPKSGTHWISNISNMLQSGKSTYLGSPDFLEFNEIETLNSLPSPRVFASHIPFDFMPREVKQGKGKVITIFRNPKDVAVSLYHFLKKLGENVFVGSWNGFLKLYLEGKVWYGSWFASFFEWENTKKTYTGDNIMYVTYEEMKQDPQKHIWRISSFLGQTHDEMFIEEVTKKCTFQHMGEAVLNEIGPGESEVSMEKRATGQSNFNVYRKGEVGDWKNHFTVSQNEDFDNLYSKQMANATVEFSFEWLGKRIKLFSKYCPYVNKYYVYVYLMHVFI